MKEREQIRLVLKNLSVSKTDCLLSIILAQISEPIPHCGQPPSTVTRWFVFIIEFMIVCSSKGRRLLKLITSQLIPSLASCSAASKHRPTGFECETNVIRSPTRSIFALPIGMRKSLLSALSSISNVTPYNNSFSKQTTGSLSRIADLSRPLQSSAEYGETTLRPEHWRTFA